VSYPVPAQREARDLPATPATQFITVVARDAGEYVLSGLYPRRGRDPYRWTGPRVELRLKIARQTPLKLVADLAVADPAFNTTGPISVHFLLDRKNAGTLSCPHPGRYHFEQDIPPEWTAGVGAAQVTMVADPDFYSARDRCRYGFLLFDAGLFPR
jgi:hypothetical protein